MDTSRRDVLRTIALAPALALPALPLMTTRDQFASALGAWRRASDRADQFRQDVFQPAQAAWRREIDAIPHIGSEFTDIAGMKYPLSTRDEWAVRMARKELVSKKAWHSDDGDYRSYCQTIVEGADWRAAEEERITATCGINPLWEQMEALDEATAQALDAVFNTPAASLHELHAKVEMIAERNGFDVDDWTHAVIADVRRLAMEDRSRG